MRSLIVLACLALAACASNPSPSSAITGETPAVSPIIIGDSVRIESAALGQTRTYNVWLPPSYATSDARYPVLYVIDGGLAQDFHHISGLAQLASISGMFRDVIVVGVETIDRRAELTSPSTDPRDIEEFPTHGHAGEFRAFLRDEVKSDVAKRYRTSGEDALIGESFAGLFIAETFLRAPDTVDAYIAISPSLWWDNASLAKGAQSDLRLHPEVEKKLYLAIANEDGLMREGVLDVVKAVKTVKAPGLAWSFSDRPDLLHSTIYHREALDALIWTFKPKEEAKH
ncbi:alpha/beta hydrolase [Hyphococcus sp.]|uniref:alpha/beta hydrolase n=1 Tax=Hyphococcus sp. TaxID=2038636 RepID=UPI0020867EC5|nr:MAG: alpha/beta family hydrolase [Marinicaulis sp.]